MRQDKSVKEELINQLRVKTEAKNLGLKLMIWGGVVGLLNLLLDGLYNTFRFLCQRGDFGTGGQSFFAKLEKSFFLFFLVWLLIWIIAIILVAVGLSKWLRSRSEIERIKIELESLK